VREMGRIKKDDVKGYLIEGVYCCPNCIEGNELGDMDEDDILTQQQLETGDDLIFCDRCKHEIT
jgi:hypothetical protein